jgi:hypothetical protein
MVQDKGKAERTVRTFRSHVGDLFAREWTDLEPLQGALDERAATLLVRLCAAPPPRPAWKRHCVRSVSTCSRCVGSASPLT